MDHDLLMKIGEVFGRVGTIEGQLVDLCNRMDRFSEKYSESAVQIAEMRGSVDIIRVGFEQLLSAVKNSGIELNVQGGSSSSNSFGDQASVDTLQTGSQAKRE